MKRTRANQILSATMAAVLSIPAAGAPRGQSAKVSEPVKARVEYMINCPDLLAVENIESALLAQIKEPGQMAQMLYDYGVLFSNSYQQAVITALEEQGLPAPGKSSKLSEYAGDDVQLGRRLKRYVLGLKKLAMGPDEPLRELAWKIVDHIAALNSEPGTLTSRIRFLQVSRLAEALRKSDQREIFEKVMVSVVRETLVLSAQQGINHVMSVWRNRYRLKVNTAYAAAIVGFGIVLANYLNFDSNYIEEVKQYARPVDGHLQFFIEHYSRPDETYSSLTSAYIQNYWALHFLSTMGGGIVGGGATLLLLIADPGRLHARTRERRMMRGLKPGLITFRITQKGQRTIDKKVQSIWEALGQEVSTGVLSIEQACKDHICNLSPLEVAYLGHIDILELEEMRDALKESLQESVIDNRVTTLRGAAEALLANESSYRAQMEFKREIEFFVDDLKALADFRETAKDALIGKIDGLSQAMAQLKKKPYTDRMTRARDGDIAKNEMVIAKVNSDLRGLQELKVNVEALNEKVRSVREILGQMETNLQELPSDENGWRPVSERVLLDLDRIPGDRR